MSGSAAESVAGARERERERTLVHVGALVGLRATPPAFSLLGARLCCWLLVRMLPGLFGAGVRLCTT